MEKVGHASSGHARGCEDDVGLTLPSSGLVHTSSLTKRCAVDQGAYRHRWQQKCPAADGLDKASANRPKFAAATGRLRPSFGGRACPGQAIGEQHATKGGI
jgi:hypothetical protein